MSDVCGLNQGCGIILKFFALRAPMPKLLDGG